MQILNVMVAASMYEYLKGTLTRDFLYAIYLIKTCPTTPWFIPWSRFEYKIWIRRDIRLRSRSPGVPPPPPKDLILRCGPPWRSDLRCGPPLQDWILRCDLPRGIRSYDVAPSPWGLKLSAVDPAVRSTTTSRDRSNILWEPGAAFKGTLYEECMYGGTIAHRDYKIQALDLL
jgi:hypothetical protein